MQTERGTAQAVEREHTRVKNCPLAKTTALAIFTIRDDVGITAPYKRKGDNIGDKQRHV